MALLIASLADLKSRNLDGNQVASRVASPGQTGTLAVDITNGKSLAIETSCVRARGCEYMNFIYFFKAQIEFSPTSPGRRN